MPFIHSINPTLANIGPFEIRYYGLVYVVGFIVVYFYFRYLIKHRKISLTAEELYDLLLYLMLGVLIGSRVVHCIVWQPAYYLAQPWKIFFVWEGGMAFHGGLIGVALATYLFWRKNEIRKKIGFAKLGDYLVIPAALMLAIGRIANFINAELPGRITTASWCWYFPGYDGCRHPQQLYSAAKRFIVFAWLICISRKKHKDGFIMWNMITLFGIGRVIIDFYRDDPTLLGLTAGQYLSLIMFLVGGIVLLKYYRNDLRNIFSNKRQG